MDFTNKKITIAEGTTYVVVEQVDLNKHTYLYLVNRNDIEEKRFVEIRGDELSEIESNLFLNRILPLFIQKMMNY